MVFVDRDSQKELIMSLSEISTSLFLQVVVSLLQYMQYHT